MPSPISPLGPGTKPGLQVLPKDSLKCTGMGGLMAKPLPQDTLQALVCQVAAQSLKVLEEGRGSVHIVTKTTEEKTTAEEGQQHVFGWEMSRVSVTDPAERRKTSP